MGFTIEWIPNEPILVVTGSGLLAMDDFVKMFAQVTQMIEGVEGPIYRISDYTTADTSFMDVMKAVKLAASHAPGSSFDPRLHTVFVGTSQWISLGRTALQQPQFGGIMVPTFVTLDDALAFARREIAKARGTASTT